MSVKARDIIANSSDALLGFPIIERITANSIYMGMVIALIIVLMAVVIFIDTEDLTYKGIRLFVWSLVPAIGLLLLRDSVDSARMRLKNKDEFAEMVFQREPLESSEYVISRAGTSTGDALLPRLNRHQLATLVENRAQAIVKQREAQSAAGVASTSVASTSDTPSDITRE